MLGRQRLPRPLHGSGSATKANETDFDGITLRAPQLEDGPNVWRLTRESGSLDENSRYFNLVQCEYFGDTCVIAEMDGEVVGWVSAFLTPEDPETLFIWQVAVDEKARGKGLAKRMLTHLLERDACADVKRIHTTITADNEASWALFNSFAERVDATLERDPLFERNTHFEGRRSTASRSRSTGMAICARACSVYAPTTGSVREHP